MAFILLAAGLCPASGGVVIHEPTEAEIRDDREAQKQRQKEQDLLKKLTQYGEKASKGCPLYESVKAELENYYGRTDFSDPGRKNGWYRVGLFLKWLSTQEEDLKREKIAYSYWLPSDAVTASNIRKIPVCEMLRKNDGQNISSDRKHSVLSVWLGAKYMADIYARPYGIKRMPVFTPADSRDGGAANLASVDGKKMGSISFFSGKYPFVEGVNLGIHEGTHLLDWIRGGDENLNEFATFSTTFLFALPLKPGAETSRYRGIRSLNGYLGEKTPCEDFLREYASFLLGAVSYQDLKQSDIFSLKTDYKAGTAAHLLRALAAYKKGNLYASDLYFSKIVVQGGWEKAQDVFAANAPDCKDFLAGIDWREEAERMQNMFPQEAGPDEDAPLLVKLSCGKQALVIEKHGNEWKGIKGNLVSFSKLVGAFAPSKDLWDATSRQLRGILDGMAKDLDKIPTEPEEFLYANSLPSDSPEGRAACRAFQRHLRGVSAGRVPPVPQGYW